MFIRLAATPSSSLISQAATTLQETSKLEKKSQSCIVNSYRLKKHEESHSTALIDSSVIAISAQRHHLPFKLRRATKTGSLSEILSQGWVPVVPLLSPLQIFTKPFLSVIRKPSSLIKLNYSIWVAQVCCIATGHTLWRL